MNTAHVCLCKEKYNKETRRIFFFFLDFNLDFMSSKENHHVSIPKGAQECWSSLAAVWVNVIGSYKQCRGFPDTGVYLTVDIHHTGHISGLLLNYHLKAKVTSVNEISSPLGLSFPA